MFIKFLCLYSQAQMTPGQYAHYSQIPLSSFDEDVQHLDSMLLGLRHKSYLIIFWRLPPKFVMGASIDTWGQKHLIWLFLFKKVELPGKKMQV